MTECSQRQLAAIRPTSGPPRTGAQPKVTIGMLPVAWVLVAAAAAAAATPLRAAFVNSVGMTMVPIPKGQYVMGYTAPLPLPSTLAEGMANRVFGDSDESPWQEVEVDDGLFAATTEVTNAQLEQGIPSHKQERCRLGFSCGDDEAAVFVSHADALDFAAWLSAKENRTYRLPYEAEWEYMARGGTTTYFWTGQELPASHQKNQAQSWYPGRDTPASVVVNLTVATASANPFGLHDVHGNVEEWCADWFAPYDGSAGPQPQRFRSTRGGSHSTELYFLRSASRAGALPADRSWYIGLRLVAAPSQASLARIDRAAAARGGAPPVRQHGAVAAAAVSARLGGPAPDASGDEPPGFARPLRYVMPVYAEKLPFTHHNHDPALVACPDGSVLATWFSTITEPGKESGIVTARLEPGAESWPRPSLHFSTPGRMDNAPDMFLNDDGVLVHVHGMSAAATWGNNALVRMTSPDCGRTWGEPAIVWPEHGLRNQPVNTAVRLPDGRWALPCDNTTTGSGGTALHFSSDGGLTWGNASKSNGQYILGIHGTVVLLRNGTLLAFGRGNDINGRMAQSVSADDGATWGYSASPFPGIHGGQRAVVQRLADGGIAFCGFANGGLDITTLCGSTINGTGLFCSVSDDEGASWPYRRLVSDDGMGTVMEQLDGAPFVMGRATAEGDGYTTARQGPDGTLHLISSRNHYRLSPEWLRSRPRCWGGK